MPKPTPTRRRWSRQPGPRRRRAAAAAVVLPARVAMLLAMLLAVLPAVLAAQVADQPARAEPYRLRSIEIVEAAWGQEVRLESDGPLERVGAQLFQGLGVVLQLPGHLPGPGVGGLESASGPVAAVELEIEDAGDSPGLRVVVRTRQPVTQSVSSGGGVLRVRLAPAALPADAPAAAAAPAAGDAVEVATLKGALERSNRARAELAVRVETLSAESETLRERVGALEAHRQVLESELDGAEAQAAELSRELAELGAQVERQSAAAARQQAALESERGTAAGARAELERRNQELEIRVQAATLERRELTRELEAATAALAAERSRAASLDGQSAGLAADLEQERAEASRLTAELDRCRGEAARQYQRARARTEADGLEQRVAELEGQLAEARSEGVSLAEAEAACRLQLADSAAAGEATEGRLGEAAAERRGLEERLAAVSRERDELAAELGRVRLEGFDRELEVAREVEYRVAELRRELEQARARVARLAQENEGLRAGGGESAASAPRSEAVTSGPAEPAPTADTRPPVEAATEPEPVAAPAGESPEPAAVVEEGPAGEPAAVETAWPAAWTTTATRLRSGPSTGAEIVAALPPASEVEAGPAEGSWTEAVLRREGWLLGRFLDPALGRDGRALTNDRVNLRDAPGLDSTVLDSLPVGTLVDLGEEQDGWHRVKVAQRGWVYSPLLSGAPPVEPGPQPVPDAPLAARVSTDANLRQAASLESAVLARLTAGSEAEAVARQGGWYRVRTAQGDGWVHGSLLRFEPAASEPE